MIGQALSRVNEQFNAYAGHYLNRNPRLSLALILSITVVAVGFSAFYFFTVEMPAYRAQRAKHEGTSALLMGLTLESDSHLLPLSDERLNTFQPVLSPSQRLEFENDTVYYGSKASSGEAVDILAPNRIITEDEFLNALQRAHQRGYLSGEDSLIIAKFNQQIVQQ